MKRLGSLEQHLMLATFRLRDDAHGLTIRREIERLTGHEVAHGAVYSTMDRLVRLGLVEAAIGEQTPVGGGRRRKFYRLTPEGAKALEHSYSGLRRMAEEVLPDLARMAAGDVD